MFSVCLAVWQKCAAVVVVVLVYFSPTLREEKNNCWNLTQMRLDNN